ncbi:hypothetical protein [Plantactinospora soyae]|uniref:hypothetical protein n=1 Tax=Plantactinospora soyae TaxID=1544732 RepID=UPI001CEF2408|nr:hypothetical protein [Plantactinospora soyae]
MQPDPGSRNGVRAGDVVHVGRSASVQFDGSSALLFRVIRVHDRPTYDGWTWLDGYQLNRNGNAVKRRTIFVQIDGLRPVARRTSAPKRVSVPNTRPYPASSQLPRQRN